MILRKKSRPKWIFQCQNWIYYEISTKGGGGGGVGIKVKKFTDKKIVISR